LGTGTQGTGSGSAGVSTGLNGPVLFNLGVQGTDTSLTLYVSRVPRELNLAAMGQDNPDTPLVFSDLRRISYWLVGGPDAPQGLARQEVTLVTSDDALESLPPNIPDEASHIIAEEVKDLRFSYFDGTQWQDSWDGTTPGPDGTTPIGPPALIAITITIAPPGVGNEAADQKRWKVHRHVVALPTANGVAQQTQQTNGQ
jgi:hypothetical protein